MNPTLVTDLLNHTSTRIEDVIAQTAALLDDDVDRNVFFVTLFGRVLYNVARNLEPGFKEETEGEVLLATALVLAIQMHDGDRPPAIDMDRLRRRATMISKKLVAAARTMPR